MPLKWNCDESGFPTDPSKGKVIAPKVSCCNHLFMLEYFSSILVLQERCDGKLTSAFFMQGKKTVRVQNECIGGLKF